MSTRPKTTARATAQRGETARRRKNFRLDQRKLDAAKRILGAASETDTIEEALDLVLFQAEAMAGMAKLVGKGGFSDVFAEETRQPRGRS